VDDVAWPEGLGAITSRGNELDRFLPLVPHARDTHHVEHHERRH
jgi:hypothetical protein